MSSVQPQPLRGLTAELGVIDDARGRRVVASPYYVIDGQGRILEAQEGLPEAASRPEIVEDLGPSLVLPGLVNAHSHAFQRLIRGRTQRRGHGDPSSFWSWREAMYRAANELDPDAFEAATRACFEEMLSVGITTVGEFHYVHHQADGTPYEDANELSKRVVAAARSCGIRVTLLEVYYARQGAQGGPLPEQRRFCDASVDAYLQRVEALLALRDDQVSVGITPHSVRAVAAADLEVLARAAADWDLPIHAHVSEQPLENEQCAAEYGKTPTQVFADAGCLDRPRRFTAVHAVFVDDADHVRLADQHVCACPTTEADLGDGIVPAGEFMRRGTRLALGSDSNAIIDLVTEARLLEMDTRLAGGTRLELADADGRVATTLLDAATVHGASALHRPELGRLAVGSPFDACVLDLRHVSLRDVPREYMLDAVMCAGSAAPVHRVFVGGRRRH